MDSRIVKLEEWRINRNLSKSWMADYFSVPDRNYNNWCYRGSLPKEKIDLADKLLNHESWTTAELSSDEHELLLCYNFGSDKQKEALLVLARLMLNNK